GLVDSCGSSRGARREGEGMPLSSSQLAALVERAKAKAPPPQVQAPAPARASAARPDPPPPANPGIPIAEPVAELPALDDFPTGWQLTKGGWPFPRKFFRLFRRPMRQGEYSFLLRQVWQRRGKHLGENYWRVTLPDAKTTLVVTATRWRLVTILPK